MRISASLLSCLSLVACVTTYDVPSTGTTLQSAVQQSPAVSRAGGSRTAADFERVRRRIEPVAEQYCREEMGARSGRNCDFNIVFESSRKAPPNAFQTMGKDGRPLVIMTANLLRQMRSDHEIAMVMSHETGHHIAGHLNKTQQSQLLGALILGGIVAVSGGDSGSGQAISNAMDAGAALGGRVYSQQYELEADWIGAFITARSGYDVRRGAQIFNRPALSSSGGPVILSTHPSSPKRRALIEKAATEIDRQTAQGLVPSARRRG